MHHKILVFLLGMSCAGRIWAAQEISEQAARSIAVKEVPGKILEVEKEKHKGVTVYSVEIQGTDGIHEIFIDMLTGKIIEKQLKGPTDVDTDDD